MKQVILKLMIILAVSGLAKEIHAQTNNIEVAQATLSAYTTTATEVTPFETIDFQVGFPAGVTPNVFILTPEFGAGGVGGTGDDPCIIRVQNVTNAGFDAVCLEPHDENRNSVSVMFDYIAIAPGQVDIPTTTAGESVTFFSGCEAVSEQQFGPSCDDCTGTTGYQTVNFPAGLFSSSPALLTQLSSSNNTLSAAAGTAPAGEPEFVSAAVDAIGAASFDVAVERLEAGIDDLDESEQICYLAVEDDGCKTLDLSSTNGAGATVNFEAVINNSIAGGNQGHDDTARSSATFEGSCFSTPPIVAASMRDRRGNNGGFLRRDGLSATSATFLVDEDQVSDNERVHIPEPISALAFSSSFTNPVTLSRVKVSQIGRKVTFDWQTSAESFHLGFHLWGETHDGWVQLNRRLVPGFGVNTDQSNRYQETVRLSREQNREGITAFGLSTVDTSGFEEFYGPFLVGEEYGDEDTSEAIDWNSTRRQHDANMRERGFTMVGGRWRRISDSRAQKREQRQVNRAAQAIEVTFNESGMHQVPMQDLLAVRPEWNGIDVDRLAVTLNGRSVERLIVSDDQSVSDDDYLIFNVASPRSSDDLYISNYVYRILLGRGLALDATHTLSEAASSNEIDSFGYRELRLTSDKQYSAAQATGSPWFDTQLFTLSTPVSQDYTFAVNGDDLAEQSGRLKFKFSGGLDLPGNEPDHHVQVRVNGELVADQWFDGVISHVGEVVLPLGVLTAGDNQLSVTLPGDTGLLADIVLIDEVSVLVPHALEIGGLDVNGTGGNKILSFMPDQAAEDFLITAPESIDIDLTRAFAHASNGSFSTIELNTLDAGDNDQKLTFAALPFVSSVVDQTSLSYTIANPSALPSPASLDAVIMPNEEKYQVFNQADLMIVSHPNFIGEKLDNYIKFKQDLGLSVQLIDWFDLVAKFGHGNNTPNALDNYLESIDEPLRPKHVLVVGGHTFDYKDDLGQGAVNFIPAHYRPVGVFEFTPSDNVFADIDGDNLPDLAIGRWPVRTQTDLATIVDKSIAWQTLSNGDALAEDVLFIAQKNDGQNLDFQASLEGNLASNLNHQ